MYIIEFAIKIIEKFKNRKTRKINEDDKKCSHIFLPIDSTGKIFSCSKCGFVIKKEELDKLKYGRNFFK